MTCVIQRSRTRLGAENDCFLAPESTGPEPSSVVRALGCKQEQHSPPPPPNRLTMDGASQDYLDYTVAPSDSEAGVPQQSYQYKDGMIVISDSEDEGDVSFSTAPIPALPKTRPQHPPKRIRSGEVLRARSSSSPALKLGSAHDEQELGNSPSGTPLAEINLLKQTENLLLERDVLLGEKRKWETWLATQGCLADNHEVAEAFVYPKLKTIKARLKKLPAPFEADLSGADSGLCESAAAGPSTFSAETSQARQPASTPSQGSSRESSPLPIDAEPEWLEVLQDVFGFDSFLPRQLEGISATLAGRDVIARVRTGGGKSLLYQLPSFLENRRDGSVTFVLGPLLALKNEQLQKCEQLGIPAVSIDQHTDLDRRQEILSRLDNHEPDIALFFITPQMLHRSKHLRARIFDLYRRGKLRRFVIDEFHSLLSATKKDEAQQALNDIKTHFPETTLLALSGTATVTHAKQAAGQLQMRDPKYIIDDLNRPNLFYEIQHMGSWSVQQVLAARLDWIKAQDDQSGIIFCPRQDTADEVADILVSFGLNAVSYHAAKPVEKKREAYEQWMANEAQIMCATLALGMGIDKPDVRFVLHLGLPRSIDSYFQETGRAGRDGQPARCLAFYSDRDRRQHKHKSWSQIRDPSILHALDQELQAVYNYFADISDCRRTVAWKYFGGPKPYPCNRGCDYCQARNIRLVRRRDCSKEAQKFVELLREFDEKDIFDVTTYQAILIANGSRSKEMLDKKWIDLENWRCLKSFRRKNIELLVNRLLTLNALREEQRSVGNNGSATYIKLGPECKTFLKEDPPSLYMHVPVSKKSLLKEAKRKSKSSKKQEKRRARQSDRQRTANAGSSGSNESTESASGTAERSLPTRACKDKTATRIRKQSQLSRKRVSSPETSTSSGSSDLETPSTPSKITMLHLPGQGMLGQSPATPQMGSALRVVYKHTPTTSHMFQGTPTSGKGKGRGRIQSSSSSSSSSSSDSSYSESSDDSESDIGSEGSSDDEGQAPLTQKKVAVSPPRRSVVTAAPPLQTPEKRRKVVNLDSSGSSGDDSDADSIHRLDPLLRTKHESKRMKPTTPPATPSVGRRRNQESRARHLSTQKSVVVSTATKRRTVPHSSPIRRQRDYTTSPSPSSSSAESESEPEEEPEPERHVPRVPPPGAAAPARLNKLSSSVQHQAEPLSISDDDEEDMQGSADETEQASEYEPDANAMDDPFQESDAIREEQEEDSKSDESDLVVKPPVLFRRAGRSKPMTILDSDEEL